MMRKEKREAQEKPLNFTCGVCKQVHQYVDDVYACPNTLESEEEI